VLCNFIFRQGTPAAGDVPNNGFARLPAWAWIPTSIPWPWRDFTGFVVGIEIRGKGKTVSGARGRGAARGRGNDYQAGLALWPSRRFVHAQGARSNGNMGGTACNQRLGQRWNLGRVGAMWGKPRHR